MNSPIKLWEDFWTARSQGQALSLFRMLLGIYLFAYFVRFLGKTSAVFSTYAVISPFVIPDLSLPPVFALLLYLVLLLVIVGFTIGFFTKLLAPLLLVLFTY